jgi:peptidoglycan/xylan/chitin deacetylase (PgdA/CDA1 family)
MTRHDASSSGTEALTRGLRRGVRRRAAAIGSRVDSHLAQFQRLTTRGLTIFVFHEITDTPSEFQQRTAGYTSPEVFRQQILWIGDRFEFIAPTALAQLGGSGELPDRAAVITFDDAWAGVFRAGLPILASLAIPALCFLNMATVEGAPDLSAVRLYERRSPAGGGSRLDRRLDSTAAASVVAEVRSRYRDNQDFATFQGPTATPEDLKTAVTTGKPVWFGSHLFHHWDTSSVTSEVVTESARDNARALSDYSNALPALATPYGHGAESVYRNARELGFQVVFIATGAQNRDPGAFVLDRLALEPEPSGPRDWWYATHRRRLFGTIAS